MKWTTRVMNKLGLLQPEFFPVVSSQLHTNSLLAIPAALLALCVMIILGIWHVSDRPFSLLSGAITSAFTLLWTITVLSIISRVSRHSAQAEFYRFFGEATSETGGALLVFSSRTSPKTEIDWETLPETMHLIPEGEKARPKGITDWFPAQDLCGEQTMSQASSPSGRDKLHNFELIKTC